MPTRDRDGYQLVYTKNHPFKDKSSRVRLHRLILERHLSDKYGRPIFILPYFDVHHRDNNVENNDPSNLQMLTRSEHTSLHFKKDMSGRTCFECGSTQTYVTKKGYVDWRKSKTTGNIICMKCWNSHRDRKKKFK